jgi:hypothetical protein
MIEQYTPQQVKDVDTFSKTIAAANTFKAVLEESRATVLTVFWGEGEEKNTILLDKKYIEMLNKIGFWQYQKLSRDGLLIEASDILEMETPQRVDFDYLMQVDTEYML